MRNSRKYQALYFVFYAGFSGFVAFRNVLLEDMGMSGVQMGLVGSLWVVGGVLAQPVWGFVADYTQSPKRILVVAAACSALVSLSYPLGAALPARTFLVVAAGTFLYSATRAPIVPIANSLVLRQGIDYGHVRSFGSIAFGATVLVVGFVLSRVTTFFVIYLYVAGVAVFVALVVGLPEIEETVFEGDLGTRALGLFRHPAFLVVVLSAFLYGSVSSSASAFFSVYMREVGLGDSLTGVAWAVKTVAEAALFLTVGRTALSYGTIVTLGGASFAAGLVTLAFFPTLVPVVGANIGLGAGLALLYFAFVNVAHAVAPDDLQSTAQTLLTSVGIGAGGALGQVVSGWLVDAVGVQRLYLFLGATALLLVAAGVAVHATVGDRDGDVASA